MNGKLIFHFEFGLNFIIFSIEIFKLLNLIIYSNFGINYFSIKILYLIISMSQNPSANKSSQFTRKKIQEFSYGLNDVIGKGYSSQVYKGRHDDTCKYINISEQPVAVKVIDMKMLKNQINRTLLESEIEILKELKQVQNVLTLHEVYTTKNNTYIITELCNSDLNKRIKNKLSQQDVYRFMDQIIQGYMQVYQKQIVHRDLKPANLLITQSDQVKIADFGFAIKAQELLKPSKYNVGSPLYMAPESLRKNQYSYKTDLWSIGVIFYQMLTTETPWKAKTEKELLKKIQTEKIQQIIQRKKFSFSGLTKQFLSKCLCVDKFKRLDPKQLKNYAFKSGNQQNILTQTKTNNRNKTLEDIKINTTFTSPKNQLFEKQLFSKNGPLKTLNYQTKTANCQNSLSITCNTNKQSSNIKNPFQLKKDVVKSISKQLISEIHYCRYLFKLLGRIKQSSQKGNLRIFTRQVGNLEKQYTSIIKHKIQNLIKFESNNFLAIDQKQFQEYKQTSDYKKIIKISRQYKERYKTDLNQYWNHQFNGCFSTEQTSQLMNQLIAKFQLEDGSIRQNIQFYEKDIIILDYLMTSKQLLQMLVQGQNYEKFARKSKIEDIVEGTTTTITPDLYQKIVERAKDIVDIKKPLGVFARDQIKI